MPRCHLLTPASHWCSSRAFPPVKLLHTHFPLSRMLFTFLLADSSFFYRTQPACASKESPFLTITSVLFSRPCLFLPQKELLPLCYICLFAGFGLSSPPKNTCFCGRDHTGLCCSIFNPWYNAWHVIGAQ